jgi:hypothetical protein
VNKTEVEKQEKNQQNLKLVLSKMNTIYKLLATIIKVRREVIQIFILIIREVKSLLILQILKNKKN